MKDLRKGKVSLGLVFCFFLTLPLLLSSSGFCQDDYVLVLKWGSKGTGDGQFQLPTGIAIDSEDNIYVADQTNNRIQKFDSNGNFITKWGSDGTGDGQFKWTIGVAVDSEDNVYVTDWWSPRRVQKFDSNGNFIKKWESYLWSKPVAVAVDPEDYVYVADQRYSKIWVFDSDLNFITKWGAGGTPAQLTWPWFMATDSDSNIYVSINEDSKINKFDSAGNFLTTWGSWGIGDGQFRLSMGVAINSFGLIYVVDRYNHRIQVFDSNGNFLTKWGSWGKGDGQFSYPEGIAIDSSGCIYVADRSNQRIQKFIPNICRILSIFDEGDKNEKLIGCGPGNSAKGRQKAFRNMLKSACELVEAGFFAEACQLLLDAYNRCDGQPKPPDFVEGEAAPQLAGMIQAYRAYLGCNQ